MPWGGEIVIILWLIGLTLAETCVQIRAFKMKRKIKRLSAVDSKREGIPRLPKIIGGNQHVQSDHA